MKLQGEFHTFITGTSGSIGGALARAIRKSYPQAKLSLVDRDAGASKRLETELGGRAQTVVADLSDMGGLLAVHSQAVDAFGQVDLLVNCAGVMDVRSLENTPWDVGERVLMVDMIAPMRLMNLCVPPMAKKGGGVVVNISSMAGKVRLKGCTYYCAAKSGLAAASEIAREELAPKNIRVLTVYPGPVASALEKGARSQYASTAIANAMPNGDPDILADKVLAAIGHNSSEVVYPDIYKLGSTFRGFGGIADWITINFGPKPRE